MKKLLEIKNLSVKIAHKKICDDLNICLYPGDIWGILGPNGSGKTTLLHTLAGWRAPFRGEIELNGKSFKSWRKKNIAQKLGILLQDTQFIFPQTIFEYCLAGRFPHLGYFSREKQHDHEITLDALTIMELDSMRNQAVFSLSGGERRRLAIAALLAQNPDIYLLDEPTNHLDIRYQIKILDHFQKLSEKNSAVCMSLHDINLAERYCNKILLLFDDGEILYGDRRDVLNGENLTRLYKHPLRASVDNIWLPA